MKYYWDTLVYRIRDVANEEMRFCIFAYQNQSILIDDLLLYIRFNIFPSRNALQTFPSPNPL